MSPRTPRDNDTTPAHGTPPRLVYATPRSSSTHGRFGCGRACHWLAHQVHHHTTFLSVHSLHEAAPARGGELDAGSVRERRHLHEDTRTRGHEVGAKALTDQRAAGSAGIGRQPLPPSDRRGASAPSASDPCVRAFVRARGGSGTCTQFARASCVRHSSPSIMANTSLACDVKHTRLSRVRRRAACLPGVLL